VLLLFAEHVGGAEFEPLSTTGVPLATRDDWREVLATAREIGTTTVWLAFHGLAEVHDAVVARLGVFAETCLAIERSHTAGLRVGANVFVTKRNLPRIAEFAVALQDLRLDEMSWEPASFTPTPRGRQFERQRPALQDLQPHVETILSCTNMSRDRWPALDDFTEAAHRQRALDGDWPTYDPPARSEVGLAPDQTHGHRFPTSLPRGGRLRTGHPNNGRQSAARDLKDVLHVRWGSPR
jgi:hypothetical protein